MRKQNLILTSRSRNRDWFRKRSVGYNVIRRLVTIEMIVGFVFVAVHNVNEMFVLFVL
jgi:hypothetical protein